MKAILDDQWPCKEVRFSGCAACLLSMHYSLEAITAAILIQIPRTDNSTHRIIASPPTLQQAKLMSSKKSKKPAGNVIALNRKARHDYFIEDTLEAGLVLEGWEVKSLRAGNVQLAESYVYIRSGEAWLFGAHFSPLSTASTHVKPDPTRNRKLLIHRQELDRLIGAVERKGFALVPLDLHWHKGRAKLNVGMAKGKKQHDKRATDRERDWKRQKERILKR
jgi:SsrA-binding protein